MIKFAAGSMEEVHRTLMGELLERPDFRPSPRGSRVHELVASGFELTDPRNRLILHPARAANYGFAVGELCWYIRGDSDLETMAYYNKRMSQFSDDGKTINSAYGMRMFEPIHDYPGGAPPHSQWGAVLKELKDDPDSRRAVIHINQPRDLFKATCPDGSKDVPCTMALQFMVRDRRLVLHVTMRSNDLVWGTPYDVFSFTCLQECMLYELQDAGVPVDDLGSYHHTATSLHVYDRHLEMAAKVANGPAPERPAAMKPFTLEGMELIAHVCEPDIRRGRRIERPIVDLRPLGETELWMLDRLNEHREKRLKEAEGAGGMVPNK